MFEEGQSGRRNRDSMLLAGAACVMSLMIGTTAHAQARPEAGADASAPSGNAFGEIIVTAQKRSESINKVGMSIAAFDGGDLKAQGISSVEELTRVVPGFTFAQTNLDVPVYTLRGVGFFESSLAAYPAVSVYVDQVPLPFPAMTTQVGFDLERVEVLKGPQGTLFGQNSTGGAINYIAAKPTSTLKAGIDLSLGRFATVDGTAYVSGPLSSTLRGRLAVNVVHGDEWQQGYTNGDKLGKRRTINGRLLLDWDPVDTLQFELNLNAWSDKSDPQGAQYYKQNFQFAFVPAPLLNYPTVPANNARAADWSTDSLRPRGDRRQFQGSLRANYDITPDIALTSITAYADYKRNNTIDSDGISLHSYDFFTDGRIKTFSQELRLSNGSGSNVRWILGGNYEHSDVSEFLRQFFPDGTAAPATGLSHANLTSQQRLNNLAGFGNVEFDLSDKITIKGGARYTSAKRHIDTCTLDTGDGTLAAFWTGLSSALRGSPTPPIAPGACVSLSSTTFLPGAYNASLNEHNLSWKVGLDYHLTPTTLLYANVTRGYKAGSFPTIIASTDVQFAPVTQESVLSYEAGFKLQAFDRKVSFSGAAFDYEYQNKQIKGKILDNVFFVLDALVNVPRSRVRGAELSMSANPIPGLTGRLSGTYLDTKVTRYVGVNGAGQSADFSGSLIPYTPKWQGAASLDYQFPVSAGYDLFVGGNFNYSSSTNAVIGGDSSTEIPSYGLLDLRAGITSSDAKWRVWVWGRNVTNKYYISNVQVSFDQILRYTGRPATYGLALSYHM